MIWDKHRRWTLSIVLFATALFAPASIAEDGGMASLRESSKAFAAVAQKVSPAVVFIKVERTQTNTLQNPFPFQSPFRDDFFKRFFGEPFPGFPRQEPPREAPRTIVGQGSGFGFAAKKSLLSNTTYILTNNHVVGDADIIRVTAQDGREFKAKVTGSDPKSDLAVIEISGELPILSMGDSTQLDVGEWVVAIGNPFGLSHTLTVGVVSAKGRRGLGINDYEDFIQTDAAINPGNSGGPLVNLDGEVVGINTAIFSRSGGYMGVGFAIPANLAKNVADQLINQGEVTRGYLGIVIQELTPELAESFDLKDKKGILIAQVTENSPADKAGLKSGDLIIEYQGRTVTDLSDFRNRVALTPPESKANIRIIRNEEEKQLSLKIGKLREEHLVQKGSPQKTEELGITVQTLTPALAEQFDIQIRKGVVVTAVSPGAIADKAGIQPGTVILQVDRSPVNSASEFRKAVKNRKSKKQIMLLVRERGISRFVVLRW